MSMAESIWNNLMSRFKQDDAPRVYEIEQRLSTIKQGSKDVSAYCTELITLWEEYKNYIELPVCTCGKCECNAAMLWEKLQQCSCVTKFLVGLNEVYDQMKRHILMLKPIPCIEEVYNMVAQDERQRQIRPVIKTDNVVFQASEATQQSQFMESFEYAAAYNAYKPKSARPICTHCGKSGHVVQKCYRLIGFPPGYKNTGSSGFQNKPSYRGTSGQSTEQQKASTTAVSTCYGGCNLSIFLGEYAGVATIYFRTVAGSFTAVADSLSGFRNDSFMF